MSDKPKSIIIAENILTLIIHRCNEGGLPLTNKRQRQIIKGAIANAVEDYRFDEVEMIVQARIEQCRDELCEAVSLRAIMLEESKMSKSPVMVIESSDAQDFEKQCVHLDAQGYKLVSAPGGLVNSEQYDFCSSFTAIFALPEVLASSIMCCKGHNQCTA